MPLWCLCHETPNERSILCYRPRVRRLALFELRGCALVGLGSMLIMAAATAQNPTAGISRRTAYHEPGLRQEATSEAVSVEGLIRLDISVTDETGSSVADLRRTDFKVLDNDQARKIVAFRGPNGLPTDPHSLTVSLLIDTLDLPPAVAASHSASPRGDLMQRR